MGGTELRAAISDLVAADRQRLDADAREVKALVFLAEHYSAGTDPIGYPAGERFGVVAHDGTPPVSDFLILELAAARGCSLPVAAGHLHAALDLKYRHPHTYQLVLGQKLPWWVARKVTTLCGDLSQQTCQQVDAGWARQQGGLPVGRKLSLLKGLIVAADPALAAQQAHRAQQDRYVEIGRYHHTTMHASARLDVLDGLYLDACVDRIADILTSQGHPEPKRVLRATALGILATPARALHLLQHATQPALDDPTPHEIPLPHLMPLSDKNLPPAGMPVPVSAPVPGERSLPTARTCLLGRAPAPGPRLVGAGDPAPVGIPAPVGVLVPDPASAPDPIPVPGRVAGSDEVVLLTSTELAGRAPFPPEAPHPTNDPYLTSAPCPASTPRPGTPRPGDPCLAGNPRPGTPGPAGIPRVGDPHPVGQGLPRLVPGHELCGRVTTDPDQLLPRATIVLHLAADTTGELSPVARLEHAGAVPLERLRDLLTEVRVTIRPVIDLNQTPAVDRYEIPTRLREAVLNRYPYDAFPYSTYTSRNLDLDHTTPYRTGGPPAQTRWQNLAPLNRRAHRAKTCGAWTLHHNNTGDLVWTSPLGYHYTLTPWGTTLPPDPATPRPGPHGERTLTPAKAS